MAAKQAVALNLPGSSMDFPVKMASTRKLSPVILFLSPPAIELVD